MSVPASGPARVSGLVRALWAELTKPADELDLGALTAAHDQATAALAAAYAQGVLFGLKSHAQKPPMVGDVRPASWHEAPLWALTNAFGTKAGAWQDRVAELVAVLAPGIEAGLDAELRRALRPRKRVRPLRAVELIVEGATDEAAADELGLDPRSLRGSVSWRRLREALAADELRKRR